jgi:hypothetical protein
VGADAELVAGFLFGNGKRWRRGRGVLAGWLVNGDGGLLATWPWLASGSGSWVIRNLEAVKRVMFWCDPHEI